MPPLSSLSHTTGPAFSYSQTSLHAPVPNSSKVSAKLADLENGANFYLPSNDWSSFVNSQGYGESFGTNAASANIENVNDFRVLTSYDAAAGTHQRSEASTAATIAASQARRRMSPMPEESSYQSSETTPDTSVESINTYGSSPWNWQDRPKYSHVVSFSPERSATSVTSSSAVHSHQGSIYGCDQSSDSYATSDIFDTRGSIVSSTKSKLSSLFSRGKEKVSTYLSRKPSVSSFAPSAKSFAASASKAWDRTRAKASKIPSAIEAYGRLRGDRRMEERYAQDTYSPSSAQASDCDQPGKYFFTTHEIPPSSLGLDFERHRYGVPRSD